jgi:hypothetical protein
MPELRMLLPVGAGILIVAAILLIVFALISRKKPKGKKDEKAKAQNKEELAKSYDRLMQDDVYHIFSKEFHEELRNKARLDFQKVINENAMFLQQDLRLTTSEINQYLKQEVSGKLQEEFAAYQQSIKDVQAAAVESINSTVLAAQQQQQLLAEQIQKEAEARKAQIIANFEANMAEIVSHYVVKTIGTQIDLKDQLPYIVREMEAQKEAMKQDMWL